MVDWRRGLRESGKGLRALGIAFALVSLVVFGSLGCAVGSGDAPEDNGLVDEPPPGSGEDAGTVAAHDAHVDGGKAAPIDGGAPHDAGGRADASPPAPPASDAAPPPSADDLQRCVDLINGYRAKVSAKPLTRSTALETFAAAGAEADSKTGSAHGHFISTSGGGIAWAENEIPGWPLDSAGVRGVLEDGLQMMWDEGPGGGHHDNMASTEYTEVGCGVFVTSGKEVWIVQDFR